MVAGYCCWEWLTAFFRWCTLFQVLCSVDADVIQNVRFHLCSLARCGPFPINVLYCPFPHFNICLLNERICVFYILVLVRIFLIQCLHSIRKVMHYGSANSKYIVLTHFLQVLGLSSAEFSSLQAAARSWYVFCKLRPRNAGTPPAVLYNPPLAKLF